jgi:O-antigen/teichoic acid export membrane protein
MSAAPERTRIEIEMSPTSLSKRIQAHLREFLSRPIDWFRDSVFRRLWQNAAVLLSGNLVSVLFDFVSLVVTARALGPAAFGVFVLIQTYVLVVDNLVNFQSWQAVTKYGADTMGDRNNGLFKSLVKFGTLLDIASAVFATIIAVACIFLFANWLEFDTQNQDMAVVFCIIILFNLQGTPTAILRLFDRFRLLATQRAIVACIKMIALLAAFLVSASIWTFLILWIASYVLDYMALLFLGWRELRKQGYSNVFDTDALEVSRHHPGIVRFVVSTNLSSSIRLVPSELDVLLVGLFLGASQAGIYKVARQFGMIPIRFASPLQESIYPNMAKLWAAKDLTKFFNFVIRIGLLSGTVGLLCVMFFGLFGSLVINLTVGETYGAAYMPLLVYMIGVSIYMFGVAFRPAVLSMEHADRILVVYTVSTTLYLITLLLLLPAIGVIGASLSQVVFHACWFVMMAASIYFFSQSEKKKSAAPSNRSDR